MGQQKYESEIQAALRWYAGAEWEFDDLRLASLRSGTAGSRRYPAKMAARAPYPVAAIVGQLAYRSSHLVHRFDLRLPPARHEVVTVHDLPPLRFDDEGTLPPFAAPSARAAAAVICPSEFAAAEMRELLDVSRVRVIPYGLSNEFTHPLPADRSILEGFDIRRPFVIHAAGATKRKNLAALASGWREVAASVPDVDLCLLGPPDDRRTSLFADLPHVRLVGRVDSTAVARLMAAAQAVVVPSIYEGFGLPALEGMASGVPVVAARAGALPEVCAGAAELVEPTGDAIAAGLITVLTDSERRTELRDAGRARAALFSWEKAAAAHLDLYLEAF